MRGNIGELLQIGVRARELFRSSLQEHLVSLLIGDVTGHRADETGIDIRSGAPGQPAVLAALGSVPVLEIDGHGAVGEVLDLVQGRLLVIRVHELDELSRKQLGSVVAKDLLEGRVHLLEIAIQTGYTHQIQRQPEQASQILFSGLSLPG